MPFDKSNRAAKGCQGCLICSKKLLYFDIRFHISLIDQIHAIMMFVNVVNFGLTEMAIEVFCSALHIFIPFG